MPRGEGVKVAGLCRAMLVAGREREREGEREGEVKYDLTSFLNV